MVGFLHPCQHIVDGVNIRRSWWPVYEFAPCLLTAILKQHENQCWDRITPLLIYIVKFNYYYS
jgi:hypothetical protein